MSLLSFASGLWLGYSLAVPPGPMNALIAAWALRSFRHGFAVGAGAMSADFILMIITLLLYSALRTLGQGVFAPFLLLGGAFFLYLAYKIGKSPPPERRGANPGSPLRGYLMGLSLGLVNPYQVGWWLTSGLSSIHQFGVEWAAGLFFAILTWITGFPAAVRAGWELNKRATWLAIKVFSVATLLAFGVYFTAQGVMTLARL